MDHGSPAPLKFYTCHKTVQAMKIARVYLIDVSGGPGPAALIGEAVPGYDRPTVHVTAEYLSKHNPQIGGYYVRYKDGYESFSPAKAFEDGYHESCNEDARDGRP